MHGSGAVFCSCSLLIRGPILPAVRQKLHLSPCADSRSRLCLHHHLRADRARPAVRMEPHPYPLMVLAGKQGSGKFAADATQLPTGCLPESLAKPARRRSHKPTSRLTRPGVYRRPKEKTTPPRGMVSGGSLISAFGIKRAIRGFDTLEALGGLRNRPSNREIIGLAFDY